MTAFGRKIGIVQLLEMVYAVAGLKALGLWPVAFFSVRRWGERMRAALNVSDDDDDDSTESFATWTSYLRDLGLDILSIF